MKIIPKESKILSISHNDWDGIFSQIILGNVYKNITYIDTSFYKVDYILENLDYDDYDYVFLTDIHPEKQENLYLSDKIVLLDHHDSAIKYHNPSKFHFVINNKCGSKITLKFVETMYGVSLKHLHEHCKYVNDYDLWKLKYPRSKMLNEFMFNYYSPEEFRRQFFNGRIKFTYKELQWLKSRRKVFNELYETLDVYDINSINGCVAYAREFINDLAHKLMDEDRYDIVFIRNPGNGRVSIRHQIDGLHCGNLLKERGWGGGHAVASGFFSYDVNDFKKKVLEIEKDIRKFNKGQRS